MQDFLKMLLAALPAQAMNLGKQLFLAILVYVIGRWLIGAVVSVVSRLMERRSFDKTLTNYAASTITGVLNVLLFVSILGTLGIQTATFAALFAGLGIAIGTMTGGLLGNFAAGVFLMVLRPFKVGDFITGGGITGTVTEIGPFATKINTADNILTVVGNNKIFSDNIQNFSHNAYRRVDLARQFHTGVDIVTLSADLKARILTLPNVLATPAPDIEILEFKPGGPLIAVRPYTNNAHYWQVYFDTTKVIEAYCVEKNFPAPEQALVITQR